MEVAFLWRNIWAPRKISRKFRRIDLKLVKVVYNFDRYLLSLCGSGIAQRSSFPCVNVCNILLVMSDKDELDVIERNFFCCLQF
ncbi:hypothetical protein RDABS01_008924 [Bienertia sinuspersici]